VPKIFDILSKGVHAYVDGMKGSNDERKERDKGATEEFGVPVVHASEIGGCPIRLTAKLVGKLPGNSKLSRVLFLRDGFTHEDATSALIESVATDSGYRVERDLRVGCSLLEGKLHLLGACDIALEHPDNGIEMVYEHKAVNKNNFELYKTDNYALPNEYLVQCATYVHLLGAEEGLIVVKNRESSELYPNPFGEIDKGHHFYMDAKRAKDILSGAENILQRCLDGEFNESMVLTYASKNCSWCENKKNCYPKNPDEDETLAEDTITEPDTAMNKAMTDVFTLKKLADKYVAGFKDAKDTFEAILIRNKAKKVMSHRGSLTIIRRKGSTYPVKSEVKRLIEEGVLKTTEGSGYSYLGVYPKAETNEDDD